ncbi:hypothetical protein BJ508DRAFT_316400, partial [Ascobolus immersus RN42]
MGKTPNAVPRRSSRLASCTDDIAARISRNESVDAMVSSSSSSDPFTPLPDETDQQRPVATGPIYVTRSGRLSVPKYGYRYNPPSIIHSDSKGHTAKVTKHNKIKAAATKCVALNAAQVRERHRIVCERKAHDPKSLPDVARNDKDSTATMSSPSVMERVSSSRLAPSTIPESSMSHDDQMDFDDTIGSTNGTGCIPDRDSDEEGRPDHGSQSCLFASMSD